MSRVDLELLGGGRSVGPLSIVGVDLKLCREACLKGDEDRGVDDEG